MPKKKRNLCLTAQSAAGKQKGLDVCRQLLRPVCIFRPIGDGPVRPAGELGCHLKVKTIIHSSTTKPVTMTALFQLHS